MCSRMYSSVATSCLKIATSVFMMCNYAESMGETVLNEIFSNPCNMLSVSLSMLLYLVFVLDKHLLEKAMQHSAILSGPSLCGQFIPFLVSRSHGPKPTPETSVSK